MSEQEIPNQKVFVPHVLAALNELGKGVELDIQQIYDKTKIRMLNKKLLSAEQLQQRQATGQKRKLADVRIWGGIERVAAAGLHAQRGAWERSLDADRSGAGLDGRAGDRGAVRAAGGAGRGGERGGG
jgi:hypothetical protein